MKINPLTKSSGNKKSIKNTLFDNLPTVDISSGMSVGKMKDIVIQNMKSSSPSSCWFIWSGERKLEKQRMDVAQQRNILEMIDNLMELEIKLNEIEARKVFNGGLLNCILEAKQMEADRIFEENKAVIFEYIARQDRAMQESLDGQQAYRHRESEEQRRQTESDSKIHIDTIIAEANAQLILAQAGETTARAGKDERINGFLQYIMDNELSKFSDSAKIVITALAMGQSGKELSDLEQNKMFEPFFKRIKEQEAKQSEAETRTKTTQAEQEEIKTENKKWTFEEKKKNKGTDSF